MEARAGRALTLASSNTIPAGKAHAGGATAATAALRPLQCATARGLNTSEGGRKQGKRAGERGGGAGGAPLPALQPQT